MPSAIAAINGQDVTEFLTEFAASNSLGYSNPDADWNNLMYSPAQNIQYINNALDGSSPFYPGNVLSINFENGSTISTVPWVAVYSDVAAVYNNVVATSDDQDCESSIKSKWDLYSCYVVNEGFGQDVDVSQRRKRDVNARSPGIISAKSLEHKRQVAPDPQNRWNDSAYPSNPVIAEPDLGVEGVLSGYFLDDSVTAVLSIPNFAPGNVSGFSDTVGRFLQLSTANGRQKIVIDLQQNYGGYQLLATDVFKQFFPTIEPFAGSREHAQPFADAIRNTFTNAYNFYEDGSNSSSIANDVTYNIWPASIYIDAASGQNFSSWAQHFGPNADRGDLFTTTQRDNLSSVILDEEFVGEVVYGYANRSNATARTPYAAEDIVILTYSLCASTCTLFVEMMHHEAGVKIVTAGGRPRPGPIQAMGGTRGALDYDADSLDLDILNAESLNETLNTILPNRDVSFRFDEANFNLRDQVRNDSNFPLQFSQEPADCRIFYTPSTYNNYTALWQYAADAIWKSPSLCVSLSPTNSSESANLNDKAEDIVALEPRRVNEDSGGPPIGTLCSTKVPNFCGDLICVQSPSCKGNTFLPNTYQCQIACGGNARSCARGQTCMSASASSCPFPGIAGTSCNYCDAKQVTRQTCHATSTTNQVPHGLQNTVNGAPARPAQAELVNERGPQSHGDAILWGFED